MHLEGGAVALQNDEYLRNALNAGWYRPLLAVGLRCFPATWPVDTPVESNYFFMAVIPSVWIPALSSEAPIRGHPS